MAAAQLEKPLLSHSLTVILVGLAILAAAVLGYTFSNRGKMEPSVSHDNPGVKELKTRSGVYQIIYKHPNYPQGRPALDSLYDISAEYPLVTFTSFTAGQRVVYQGKPGTALLLNTVSSDPYVVLITFPCNYCGSLSNGSIVFNSDTQNSIYLENTDVLNLDTQNSQATVRPFRLEYPPNPGPCFDVTCGPRKLPREIEFVDLQQLLK